MAASAEQVARLNELYSKRYAAVQALNWHEIDRIDDEIAQIKHSIDCQRATTPVEVWLILACVAICLLAFLMAGGLGIGVVFCPIVIFWVVGYGLIWKTVLDK